MVIATRAAQLQIRAESRICLIRDASRRITYERGSPARQSTIRDFVKPLNASGTFGQTQGRGGGFGAVNFHSKNILQRTAGAAKATLARTRWPMGSQVVTGRGDNSMGSCFMLAYRFRSGTLRYRNSLGRAADPNPLSRAGRDLYMG